MVLGAKQLSLFLVMRINLTIVPPLLGVDNVHLLHLDAGRDIAWINLCLLICILFTSGCQSWWLVFTGSVLWTEKIHRTKLNRTVVQSIFQLWLPKFGVILVAGCLISKIIQNRSKTGWNQLQLVKWSHALHSLVTTFITFNLIFGSSKMVKNWER